MEYDSIDDYICLSKETVRKVPGTTTKLYIPIKPEQYKLQVGQEIHIMRYVPSLVETLKPGDLIIRVGRENRPFADIADDELFLIYFDMCDDPRFIKEIEFRLGRPIVKQEALRKRKEILANFTDDDESGYTHQEKFARATRPEILKKAGIEVETIDEEIIDMPDEPEEFLGEFDYED